MNKISYKKALDKIHGCWYGKCLGGAAGAPVEGIKKLLDIDDFSTIFNPDLPNDDLDLQLLWLDVLEQKGPYITSCDLADAWIEKCWYPFSEYGYFMKNYMRGIKPPYSGIINNSFFAEGMGCPIRSEIWGIISMGNPSLASQYAYIDACLDHSNNSVYAEQYLASVESLAFFEDNIVKLAKDGMQYIPEDSKLYKCFEKIFELYEAGETWQNVRTYVLRFFGHPDFTNVVQNLGFVLISLLYGKGDMRDTINIALKCGFDTDCTCASAASIVGIVKGYDALGELKTLIKDYFICGIDVQRPSDSIRRLAEDSLYVALKVSNSETEITDVPFEFKKPAAKKLKPEYPTAEGLEAAKLSIAPMRWIVYGPYFDQPDWPMDDRYPSPHGEGCVLPDIVCMVNNEVELEKMYIPGVASLENQNPLCKIDSYEDFIDLDSAVPMEGQMCCYVKTVIESPEDRKVWAIIGNNDGFKLWLNGEEIKSKDEIRLWTPYNNFELLDLKKGDNEIVIKLLKRTENLKFSFGLRNYENCHWHRCKWATDLIYK